MGDRLGVVVMAYGTPASPDDVEAYYTHIRRGRPPDRRAARRPRAPLRRHRRHLAARRAHRGPARRARRRPRRAGAGPLHGRARPEARGAVHRGRRRVAPRRRASTPSSGSCWPRTTPGFSVGQYQERLAAAAGDAAGRAPIDSWHLEPAYLDFLAAAVRDGLAGLPERTKVLFTAHSLPERALVDDPYPDQLRESAAAVAEAVGLDAGGLVAAPGSPPAARPSRGAAPTSSR